MSQDSLEMDTTAQVCNVGVCVYTYIHTYILRRFPGHTNPQLNDYSCAHERLLATARSRRAFPGRFPRKTLTLMEFVYFPYRCAVFSRFMSVFASSRVHLWPLVSLARPSRVRVWLARLYGHSPVLRAGYRASLS